MGNNLSSSKKWFGDLQLTCHTVKTETEINTDKIQSSQKTLYITVFKVCVLTFMFKMNGEPFQVQVNSPVCVS